MKPGIFDFIIMLNVFGMCTYARTDYMLNHCGGHISLTQEQAGTMELQLTSDVGYSPYSDCYLTIGVESNMRIQVLFLEMDIYSFYRCPGDFLQVFDGLRYVTEKSFHFSDPRVKKYCGDNIPAPLTSQYNNVTLRFVSDGVFHGQGFSLLLTAFHEGLCTDEEYRCSNSRCIHQSLNCNSQNHCGDNSNSCPIAPYLIIGYVVTSVILVVAIIFLIIVLRYRCSKDGQDDSHDRYIDYVPPPMQRLSIDTLEESLVSTTSDNYPGVALPEYSLSSVSIITCQQTHPNPNNPDA